MISRLININIENNSNKIVDKPVVKTNFSVKDYAKSFINGMEKSQLKRFKKMLDNNIEAGMSVAQNYGVNYDDFINEVKNELNLGGFKI